VAIESLKSGVPLEALDRALAGQTVVGADVSVGMGNVAPIMIVISATGGAVFLIVGPAAHAGQAVGNRGTPGE
jgi:hypothetical protein